MPNLSSTLIGVALSVGLTAMLAATTGATVKIAGNELGAKGTTARALTGLVGLLAVLWGGWSLREQSFGVSEFVGSRVTLVKLDSRACAAEVEVAGLVRYRHGPGPVRYEVRIGAKGIIDVVKTFRQEVDGKGSGSDLLGPKRIRLTLRRPLADVRVQFWVVAPSVVGGGWSPIRAPVIDDVHYLGHPQARCAPPSS